GKFLQACHPYGVDSPHSYQAENGEEPDKRFFAVFGVMGKTASPTACSYLHSPTAASPYLHRSLPVAPLIRDKRCYGEAPVCIRRGSGETPVRLPGIQRRVGLGN